jgi:hypothetical protein
MYDLNPVSLHIYGVTYDELDEDQKYSILSILNKK